MTIGLAIACSLCIGIGVTLNETAYPVSASDGLSLFMPSSYEQYLDLNAPTDATMNEKYIAVADGNALYLYDRATESYSRYLHYAGNGDARILSKLQFSSDGRLFFSTQDAQLYEFDIENKTAEIQSNIPCSTFVIADSTLYTAAVSPSGTTIYSMSLNDALVFDNVREIGTTSSTLNATPRLTVAGGVLYCAIDYHIYSYTYDGTRYVENLHELSDVSYLTSFHYYQGEFYYTINGAQNGNGLYRASFSGASDLLYEGRELVSLFTYDNSLFCVQGKSIRQLTIGETQATLSGYEIGAGSNAINRINSAGETVRAGNLFVIADAGNHRVLVYHTKEETFTAYDNLGGTPEKIATDGTTFAVGVGSNILVYEYGNLQPIQTYSVGSNVTGIACVYGTYYYTTHNRDYGIVSEQNQRTNRQNTDPVAITNDLYGNLYVADANGSITKYTEVEFATSATGTLVSEAWSLPSSFSSLRADYEGNLYYLSGKNLYRNGAVFHTLSANGLLYFGENSVAPTPVSFSLCFEDNNLYVNYGNFILFTDALDYPTLSTISAENVYHSVSQATQPNDLKFVTVEENSVGIELDLSALSQTSQYLPYQSHARISRASGVVLAESGDFSLVALYRGHGYKTYLCPTNSCTIITASKQEHISATRYISNEVSVTNYPMIFSALRQTKLARATKVDFLFTVFCAEIPDYAFAYISYERNGQTQFGYIPINYLTTTNPIVSDYEQYRMGFLKPSDSGITFYNVNDRSDTLQITDRTQVLIYSLSTDTFNVVFTAEDGTQYTAQVTSNMLEFNTTDPLRIGLIIILCVIAVGIGTGYLIYVLKKRHDEM